MIENPIEIYLQLRQSPLFADLDEEIVLSMLSLADEYYYESGATIIPQGVECNYVYIFLADKTESDGTDAITLFGMECLVSSYEVKKTMKASEEGIHALIIPKVKMVAFLNEEPDLLIALLKHI